MKDVPSMFGSLVFNDRVMQSKLPKDVYKSLKRVMMQGESLPPDIADTVAAALKDWATEHGATHFTHWFQPMTGITAEKHDGFIVPDGKGGVIMDFSGKELIRGEPDASSFPSGGLRATFEARGYTVWDTTSYAFLKDGTLFIPTAFCSYSGEALDKKTPLLRSMEALNTQALRVLRLFGNTSARRVMPTVGPEQEYFLVDKAVFLKRPDLRNTGRTLFGARPSKGQEMDDHYFGSLKPRVSAFMHELEEELWKLGVLAKTKHNEVAPGQHELAPIFSTSNISADHNQLTMELMKSIAGRHGLVCLLHEKPFAGVNGSGKHNNWSLSTDEGTNLLEPGDKPEKNTQFLLFLVAVITAVDEYQDMLRMTVSSAGNDHRLGANEAPPAIVSMFLGDELTAILEAIDAGSNYHGDAKRHMEIGISMLPSIPRDTTDRNRTSPFAFTGNKFEFRMPGSSCSISGPNIAINTAVADVLRGFADTLELAEDFESALSTLIAGSLRAHKRIIFNGNNYSDEWVQEAKRRGLSNYRSTPEALPSYISEKNVAAFRRNGVLSEGEVHSRYEIHLENYCKTLHIEALTMVDMVKQLIIPAVLHYQRDLAGLLERKQTLSSFDSTLEGYLLERISTLSGVLLKKLQALESAMLDTRMPREQLEQAHFYRESVFTAMNELRLTADELETLVGKSYWPMPSYGDILYSVN